MIDDVRARLASIEARFSQRPVAQLTPTAPSVGAATLGSFQQILATQQFSGASPVTLGQFLQGTGPTSGNYLAVPGSSLAAAAPGAEQFRPAFASAGERYGVDPALLEAVAWAESNFDPRAVSHAGAIGLMQIMPETAAGLGVDPRDPIQAIDGAARYLRTQLNSFGNTRLALAAYNAGPGAVERYGGIPPYEETTTYVDKVLGHLEQLRKSS